MTIAVARSSIFLDGTPKDKPGHREIARRYAWHAHKAGKNLPRPARGHTGKSKLITLIRLRELERIVAARHGRILPNNRAAQELLAIIGHHIVHLGPDAARHIIDWAGVWAPWMRRGEVAAIAASIIARPLKFTADTLGWRLRLTHEEREMLGITTIGAFNVNKTERQRLRKLKRAAAERKRRRRKGANSRLDYEEQSVMKKQPWVAFGMSRATWYRRGKPCAALASEAEQPSHLGGSGRVRRATTDAETSPRPAGDSIYAVQGVVSARAPAGADAGAALGVPTALRLHPCGVLGRGGHRIGRSAHPPPVLADHRGQFTRSDAELAP